MQKQKKRLIFATGNPHKIKEMNQILDGLMPVVGMQEIGCREELPETQNSLEGNALQKARYVHSRYEVDCFAEDTGLEIESLQGKPGIYTARYAGDQRDPEANMDLVLKKLESQNNRKAQFRTVIALILDKKELLFEGIVKGHIAHEKTGNKGFGYDPIFVPEGYIESFAEIDASIKNKISHRAKATQKLWEFLNKYQQVGPLTH